MKKFSIIFALFAVICLSADLFGQKAAGQNPNAPLVTKIDEVTIKELLKPNGRPLLVNFWATWCVPCREEFPELVKLDAEYKGKIDFITISLDDLAEIKRDVPKFLLEMKATMPAYLLKTPDENEVIASVSQDWQGGLPFTILYAAGGEVAHTRQGIVKPAVVREKLDGLIGSGQVIVQLPVGGVNSKDNFEKGVADAKNDIAGGKFMILKYGLTPGSAEGNDYLKTKYNIEIKEYGCFADANLIAYIKGYNEISKAEIKRKFKLEL